MAKYLRYLAIDFIRGNDVNDTRGDVELYAAVRDTDVPYLGWMYESYATPLLTNGIAKVNVFFTAASLNPEPVVFPSCPEDKPGEGIADVFEFFDAAHYRGLTVAERRLYYLDRIHAALVRCAGRFGWETRQLEEARARIVRNDFRFTFWWKKPLSSPDRRSRVQAFFDVTDCTRVYLVFFDRKMQERRRVLLCTLGVISGIGEHLLHRIQWLDARTVRVTQKNGRDYWLCTTDGEPEFHYPRGESGDPHGEYDLGRIYLTGALTPPDRERGLKLIACAAAKGYAHAIRFLKTAEAV
ncbi:MAG: SEL1-like repeat protein [Gemmataceae bacterium]|nr:SEL1-like repeat protein [Gemmataceae bacterium]